MNIHLPAILMFTRYQGFDPSPCGKGSYGYAFLLVSRRFRRSKKISDCRGSDPADGASIQNGHMTDIDVSQRPHNQPNPGAIPAQSRSSIHSIPGHRGVHLAPLQKCRLQICLLRLCLRVHLSHVRVECWKGACDHNILLDIMKCLICPKKQGFRYFVWAVLTFLGRYWLVAGVTIQSYLGYNKNLLGF